MKHRNHSATVWRRVGLVVWLAAGAWSAALAGRPTVVVRSEEADRLVRLAAREVVRYVYLRTGQLLPVVTSVPEGADAVVVRTDPAILKPQHFRLRTTRQGDAVRLEVAGGDGRGTLYAAYRLAEHLGVRFYLHGDVVPDDRVPWRVPELNERAGPLFELRGIQPFHDFPEGPDWWNADDYKAILSQLAKLRMNFLGLHTYPEGGVGPEPLVWIGLPQDVGPDGSVRFSYPARHFTTANVTGAWGYRPMKTSDYAFGAAQLFDRDDFGADYMRGMNPFPQQTTEQSNELFNRVGRLLRDVFSYAHLLGIRTCLGLETPLTVPTKVKERLQELGKDPNDPAVVQELYEGIFRRILATHPLDYFWFWTPEGWTWRGTTRQQAERTVQDLKLALAAAERVGAPFAIGTCGWVLGPQFDRALFDRFLPKPSPVSCINRNVGFSPVEPGFARVSDRPKWAIPWLEDDPALIIPQLWVGRLRRDAADALSYGCTGLMGIHWRTRILGPNVLALSRAAWDQRKWNPEFGRTVSPSKPEMQEGRLDGRQASFPTHAIADTELDAVYRTVRYDVDGYRLRLPNGRYRVTLQFCEPHYREKGRRVFGVELQGKRVIDRLDIFATAGADRALDYTFATTVSDGWLRIDFVRVVEFPLVAGIVVERLDAAGQTTTVRRINCGGPAWRDYQADLDDVSEWAWLAKRPRDLPVEDFYSDWARTQFGPEVADDVAALFTKLDSGRGPDKQARRAGCLQRPSTWVRGPGGLRADSRRWDEVQSDYAFVDQLQRLRSKVKGPGNQERFDYWLSQFRYLRAVGHLACLWGQYQRQVRAVRGEKDAARRKRLAVERLFPLRRKMIDVLGEVQRHLLAAVSTWGGLGNVANWQQHVIPQLLDDTASELSKLAGRPLPPELTELPKQYDGPARIVVPTVRTHARENERLSLRILVLARRSRRDVQVHVRPLGRGQFAVRPARHVARGVYVVELPPATGLGLEYYVSATVDDQRLVWPATAPQVNQTVVVLPEEEQQ